MGVVAALVTAFGLIAAGSFALSANAAAVTDSTVALSTPTATDLVCDPAGGAPSGPVLTVPDDTSDVAYSTDQAAASGVTVTVTATVTAAGKTLRTHLPDDWTEVDSTHATWQFNFRDASCVYSTSVQKQDSAGNDVSGATFRLFTGADGTTEATGVAYSTYGAVTTASGLAPGAYWWRETQAPAGYARNSAVWPATLTLGTKPAAGTAVTISDDPLPVTLWVELDDDQQTGTPLAGAVFQLYEEVGGAIDVANDTKIGDPVTTGADGLADVDVPSPSFGTYYWYEVTAPDRYELPNPRTSSEVTVGGAAGDVVPGSADTLAQPTVVIASLEQVTQRPTSLTVDAIDAVTGEAVGGASFALHSVSGSSDTVLKTVTTDASTGTAASGDLGFGTYYFQQTAAPDGYELPSGDAARTAQVTITAQNAGSTLDVLSVSDRKRATPVLPESVPASCDGTEQMPFEIVDAQTSGITYSDVTDGNTVTVTAAAAAGYVLAPAEDWTANQDGTVSWTHTFAAVQCLDIDPTTTEQPTPTTPTTTEQPTPTTPTTSSPVPSLSNSDDLGVDAISTTTGAPASPDSAAESLASTGTDRLGQTIVAGAVAVLAGLLLLMLGNGARRRRAH